MEEPEEQVDYSSDPSEGDSIFYSGIQMVVNIAPGGDVCRSGIPHGKVGVWCRPGNPHGSVGVWVKGSEMFTQAITQSVPYSSSGVTDGLVSSAFVGIRSGGIGIPNVDFSEPEVSSLGFPFPSIPIFSSSDPPSPLFLSEEVHSILSKYFLEPLSSVGAEALPTDLSSPGSVYPKYSSSSHGGGLGTRVPSPGQDFFVSRVLEEPIVRTDPVVVVSPSNSGRQWEEESPVRKRPKQVKKKELFPWRWAKWLRWKTFPSILSEPW